MRTFAQFWTLSIARFSFSGVAVFIMTLMPKFASGDVITFVNQSGPNLAPFVSETEGQFTVAATTGFWEQGQVFGNPVPSIILGPLLSPVPGSITITSAAGLFTWSGLDFSSNNGSTAYDITGFFGIAQRFDETGTFTSSGPVFHFNTLLGTDSGLGIDRLVISLAPLSGTTSANLDNIVVNAAVPEPGNRLLLAIGLVALICYRKLLTDAR